MPDIRRSHLTEIYNALFKYAYRHQEELRRCDCEVEDFVQDNVFNIFNRKGLDAWEDDKSKAGLEAVVYTIAKRNLVDRMRYKFGTKSRCYEGRPVSLISTETPLSGVDDGSLTLGDMLESDADLSLVMVEMLERVPDERISPRYLMTWRGLLERSLDESEEDIACSIGISVSRVQQLQRQLCEMIKQAA